MKIESFIGNEKLLAEHKTAFICSRKIPAGVVLKSYDWAIAMRNEGKCVMSGFHSPIEKDIFHFLLKGNQPIILVLARGMLHEIPPKIQEAVDSQRLLIISPFNNETHRVTQQSANLRNKFMIELADEVFIPALDPGGSLEKIIKNVQGKPIKIGFDE
jgi:hypothetical protein